MKLMKEKNIFTVIDDKGNEVQCEVLFTFDSDETGKHYIIYTDNTTDEEGNTKVYASTFDPENEKTALGAIETEKEWKIIETILDSLQNKDGDKSEQ
jgi:uncharacterized protein YrzB (UPF0473 family)